MGQTNRKAMDWLQLTEVPSKQSTPSLNLSSMNEQILEVLQGYKR